MPRPALFRRRTVWLPTFWGWLALCALFGAAAVLGVRHAYGFLSPNEPVGAHVLVVEGWIPAEELDQAVTAIGAGRYERVVTTGGPIENDWERPDGRTYAARAHDYLVRRGVPSDLVTPLPAPASAQDRSYLNAVMVRDWIERTAPGTDAVDLFSSGPHSRRSQLLHRMAFGAKVRVGILAATPASYEPAAWWRTSAGARDVIGEAIGWVWAELFFHPGAPGSHEERWAVPDPKSPEGVSQK
jgi:hypothetical protein